MTQVPSAPLVVEPSKPSPTTVIVTPLMGVLVPSIRFSSRPLTCSPSAAAGWAKANSAIECDEDGAEGGHDASLHARRSSREPSLPPGTGRRQQC